MTTSTATATFERTTYTGARFTLTIRDGKVATTVASVPGSYTWSPSADLASYLYRLRVEVPAEVQAMLDAAEVVEFDKEERFALDAYHAAHELPACGRFVQGLRNYRSVVRSIGLRPRL